MNALEVCPREPPDDHTFMSRPAFSAPSDPALVKRILVVDDDDAVREGLRDVLVAEGYAAVTAINGIQALAALRRQPCDLVLLDMNMPLLNGWGTIGELRRLQHQLPVMIITAQPDQAALARECEVDLMEKPLDLPRILRWIRSKLSAADDSDPAAPCGAQNQLVEAIRTPALPDPGPNVKAAAPPQAS